VYPNHNGGALVFGPQERLYIGVGDGGGGGNPLATAQNTASLLGKVLRIDVTTLPYVIPPGNPFVGVAGAREEIWAVGLRNPWRIAFDFPGNIIYVADVGQDDYEEVNAVSRTLAGANYGWSIMEGLHCFNAATCNMGGLTLPVLEYSHGEGCSVTGGFVYRGAAIPELVGHYFYSDYCNGWLRSFLLAGGVATQRKDWNVPSPGSVTSFGEDAEGELYVLTQSGGIFKVVRQ